MAEFRVLVQDAHRLSVASADLDVNDHKLDLSGLDDADRAKVEAELQELLDDGVVERADESADEQDRREKLAADRLAAQEAGRDSDSADSTSDDKPRAEHRAARSDK